MIVRPDAENDSKNRRMDGFVGTKLSRERYNVHMFRITEERGRCKGKNANAPLPLGSSNLVHSGNQPTAPEIVQIYVRSWVMKLGSNAIVAQKAPVAHFRGAIAFVMAQPPSSSPLVRGRTIGAQRDCCAWAQRVQRFWGPLGGKKMLRARPMRATRVLRSGKKEAKVQTQRDRENSEKINARVGGIQPVRRREVDDGKKVGVRTRFQQRLIALHRAAPCAADRFALTRKHRRPPNANERQRQLLKKCRRGGIG